MRNFNSISDLKLFYNKFKNQSLKSINKYVHNNYSHINLSTNKGIAGQLLEALIGNAPNSNPNPDVFSLGVELKVLPLRKISSRLQPKERSKIKSINYNKIIYEEFNSSLLRKKISQILFLMYEHPTGKNYKDWEEFIFKGCLLYELKNENENIVKEDWYKIKHKVINENANKLTESEGVILGACTSGSGKLITYGNNKTAKQRSYSLKHNYLKIFYSKKILNQKFISLNFDNNLNVEDYVVKTLNDQLLGKNLNELVNSFQLKFSSNSKASFRFLINKVLKIEKNSKILELEQKGISFKTIPISFDNKAWEAMSFPKFSLVDLIEEDWQENENCTFYNTIKNGFIFIPVIKEKVLKLKNGKKSYKYNNWKEWKIGKIIFWKPNVEEILTIKNEWLKAKEIIVSGVKTKTVKWGSGTRQENNLIKSSDTSILHIRPHAKNSKDLDIPYLNFSNNKVSICWQSFWLNIKFINTLIKPK
ncbi:MAG: MutH/Sau3AI family endonuclease [Flavobacteriaceae bacterium]